jgi:general stress protein 26
MNRQELLEFLRHHRLAVQTSVSPAGAPQAAIVGFAVTDKFEIIFDTLETTRKVFNLRKNPSVALVIGGWTASDERTVQFEGRADVPVGGELERLKKIYYSVYPDGRSRATWPGLIYVRVRPSWIRYSDYNHDPPAIVEFRGSELEFV